MADKNPWALKDAHILIKGLTEDAYQFGYHVALGGSVIVQGMSERDLDLYFLPLCNSKMPKADAPELIKWLTSLWGNPMRFALRPELEMLLDEDEPLYVPPPPRREPAIGDRLRRAAAAQFAAPVRYAELDVQDPLPPRPYAGAEVRVERLEKPKSLSEDSMRDHPYRNCLRFIKSDGDRIDVYII